ncbi:MAG: thiamine pyrophosphate-binding protein [Acidobacteria bacterium]|nr:thiamine pyrophosphate-binding protein [Acidobacteriota bacterium]
MKRTAVEWLVEAMQQRGVEHISALCGHGLDPLFDAATRAGIRIIDTRNEQTAGYIAECYGRLTRRPGVCASSSGVAVANALTGVLDAWLDRAPMIYLSGSANLPTLGLGCFQDLDQAGLLKPVTLYSELVTAPARIVQMWDDAWHAALSPGPVHLQLPMDIQRASVDASDLVQPNLRPRHNGEDPDSVDLVAKAINASERPILVATSAVYYSGEWVHLKRAAEDRCIPVVTPIWDRGICESDADWFLGVVGALSVDSGLLAKSDCVIIAGDVRDYRLGYLQRGNVYRLDHGWREISKAFSSFEEWLEEARALRSALTAQVRATAVAQRVEGRTHAVDIIDAIAAELSPVGTLIIDGGSIGQWAHHLLTERRYPGHWLTCGRGGVVGYGLAGGMAARLARPDAPILLLSGDGAFTFTVAEIECAVRQRLPFVILVADDQCWGITHSGHLRQFGKGLATQLGAVDFPKLAESLGARGVSVTSATQIAPAIRDALAHNTVTLLHVPISGGNPA